MKTPYDVVLRPIISERSMDDAQAGKYTFEVATCANKTEVKHALEEIFDVDVDKVNVISVKGKKKRMGRYEGFTAAKKKAIVTLKPGSKEIEFFSGL
ncbi:50S ribosomal protein L23 [Bacteroides heparinolyticus]|uniref:50S ribosomal protein L23 n=2 Tax=Prevotella heparinolytica TaxID=28113 RepID=UPI0035A05108